MSHDFRTKANYVNVAGNTTSPYRPKNPMVHSGVQALYPQCVPVCHNKKCTGKQYRRQQRCNVALFIRVHEHMLPNSHTHPQAQINNVVVYLQCKPLVCLYQYVVTHHHSAAVKGILSISHSHTHRHARTHAHVHAHTHAWPHACMHVYTRPHVDTLKHTYWLF